jgi:hypothetical protein
MSYAGLAESSHTFRVRAVDAGGNMDGEEVRYDWVVRLPPVNTTPPDFVNRRGAHLTHKNPVTVSISTTSEKGVTGYYLSESPVTPKASDPSWVSIPPAKAFSRDVPFSLSSGAGEKTVYVWFKDSEGNVSEAKGGTIYLFSSRAVSLAFLLLQVAMVLVL